MPSLSPGPATVLPDEHWGEIVGAGVVAREPAAGVEAEPDAFCRGRLATHDRPRST